MKDVGTENPFLSAKVLLLWFIKIIHYRKFPRQKIDRGVIWTGCTQVDVQSGAIFTIWAAGILDTGKLRTPGV